ncbi:MAG: hypothetical protein ACI97A_001413 [Planctomycetota bacterium]|jgi:hypothetical protein
MNAIPQKRTIRAKLMHQKVLMILIIVTISTTLIAQNPPQPVPPTAAEVAKTLKIAFQFPKSVSPIQHQTSKMSDGVKLDRFQGARDKNFRAELTFIHGKRDLDKISAWAVLGQITEKVVRSSNLSLSEIQYDWVDSLPTLRFTASPQKGTAGIHVRGQFILCSDGIVFTQTISTVLVESERTESEAFFASISRPEFEKPKGYRISLGGAEITYPPGILPRVRDGFLQLEDTTGTTGLLLCLEETSNNDRADIICALAQSLDSMTAHEKKPLSLTQGPGKLRNLPNKLPGWGFSGRLAPSKQADMTPHSKDVFVRYYQIKGHRIFVSAYATTPTSSNSQNEAVKRVKTMLGSIRAISPK